jgi:hypothetical protein
MVPVPYLRRTNPRTRFSSRSEVLADFGFSFLKNHNFIFLIYYTVPSTETTALMQMLKSVKDSRKEKLSIPELLAIGQDDVHMLVKSLELTNKCSRVLKTRRFFN